ncbi:hypothetical protein K8S19_01230 [bacterium]|nr:hypothetical protein [bacterium]
MKSDGHCQEMGETMSAQHSELAQGRWMQMSFCEQMANIGSEVSRALTWQEKGKDAMAKKAFVRALELLEFTIEPIGQYSRLKELFRVREGMVDYFYGENQFATSAVLWRKYFDQFAYAARKDT